NKSIILVPIIGIISFSLIIGIIPIMFLLDHLSTYGTISESRFFEYTPDSPSSNGTLNLNVDVGNIQINYIPPPVDYHVKIDVNFELTGSHLAGKTYLDFFNISMPPKGSMANFTLELKSDDWFDPIKWFTKNVSIVVNVRKDIVLDIIANVKEGNVEITVPWAVSIHNLLINISKGNIFYDFNYCILEGNITGIVDNGSIFYDFNHCTIDGNLNGTVQTGNMNVSTYNVKYTQNRPWDFRIDTGDFAIYINQNENIGTNITGIAKLNNGEAFFCYEDNSPDIGATFEIPFGNPFLPFLNLPSCLRMWTFWLPCTTVHGFHYDIQNSTEGIVTLISEDLRENRVKDYFNMTFEIIQGTFAMDILSIN
ncbi:MAG: hypothetical protein ACXACB_08755, partial [Promethearchaeota archaeon]